MELLVPSHTFHPPGNPRRELVISRAWVMIRKQVQKMSVTWPRYNTGIHPIFFCEAGLGAQILPYFPQFLVPLMDTLLHPTHPQTWLVPHQQ